MTLPSKFPVPAIRVTDPHPATEEDYDKIADPGGAHPPKASEIGPNDAIHNGTAPPKPDYNRAASNRTERPKDM